MKLGDVELCSFWVDRVKEAIRAKALIVPALALFALPVFPADPAEPMLSCAIDACAKQRATLRTLERARPSKKLSRQQIFNRIKATCDKMRSLDCPGIREFKPPICFADF